MTDHRVSHLWRRLTPRFLLVSCIAAALSVAGMGVFWTHFLVQEILRQVSRYTDEVVVDNLPLCHTSPETWGRIRQVGRFDAYDAATLQSPNPASPPPDPELVERLRSGNGQPARVYWSLHGGWGGYVLKQVAPSGPCSLFQLEWKAPPGSRLRGLLRFLLFTVAAVGAAMLAAMIIVVKPLVSRLTALRRGAEHVGAEGYGEGRDLESDEIGQLSLILDRAHQRIRLESSKLREREQALRRHLADVSHDLRTPLTSAQITLEQAAPLVVDHDAKQLLQRALTDIVYTSELTENLRLAAQLREGIDPLEGNPEADLTEIVERVTGRFSLLGKHRGVMVEAAYPDGTTAVRAHPVWAEQAIANLVHNAVSHGRENGHVAVVLDIMEGRSFRLTVADDGPGVASDLVERLTERSFRSRQAHQCYPGGGGIGLAITSDVCRLSGWTLTFSTGEDAGMRVTIEGGLVRPSLFGRFVPPRREH